MLIFPSKPVTSKVPTYLRYFDETFCISFQILLTLLGMKEGRKKLLRNKKCPVYFAPSGMSLFICLFHISSENSQINIPRSMT